jgi:hypothetical protein
MYEWALRVKDSNEIIRGLSEKELRIILKIREQFLSIFEVYKMGWQEWKNAKDVEFPIDDLFDPTACPQLPTQYQVKK